MARWVMILIIVLVPVIGLALLYYFFVYQKSLPIKTFNPPGSSPTVNPLVNLNATIYKVFGPGKVFQNSTGGVFIVKTDGRHIYHIADGNEFATILGQTINKYVVANGTIPTVDSDVFNAFTIDKTF